MSNFQTAFASRCGGSGTLFYKDGKTYFGKFGTLDEIQIFGTLQADDSAGVSTRDVISNKRDVLDRSSC